MASSVDNVPKPPRGRRLQARDAVKLVAAATLALLLFEGTSIESAGKQMDAGVERSIVLAIGEPTGWLAETLPFEDAADSALGFITPEEDLSGQKGFDEQPADDEDPGRGPPPITVDQFDPVELGAKAKAPRKLDTLLVTGDSLSLPLDSELAKRLTPEGVKVVRDPHVGTGISKAGVVDWAKLSGRQVSEHEPDAIVVFIGANEGFPLPGPEEEIECCGPDWAAVYAGRTRRLMDNYRQGGEARVYWLGVPLPRAEKRQRVQRTVNAAFEVAAQPWRSHVRLLDLTSVFTPNGRYRDAMEVDGRRQIVREPDGNHLNRTGAEVAADVVLEAVRKDFGK